MNQDFNRNAQKRLMVKMKCYCILVRHFKKLSEFMLVLLLWTERGEAGRERCFCY